MSDLLNTLAEISGGWGDRVDELQPPAIRDGWCDADELRYVGNVLHFYAGMLRRAGMDY